MSNSDNSKFEAFEPEELKVEPSSESDHLTESRQADQAQVEQAKNLNPDLPSGSLSDDPDSVDDSIKIVAISDGKEEVLAERKAKLPKSLEHLKALGESDPVAQAMFEMRSNLRKLANGSERAKFESVIRDSSKEYLSARGKPQSDSFDAGTHTAISPDNVQALTLDGNDNDPKSTKEIGYLDGSLAPDVLKNLEYTKKSKEYLESVRQEIEKNGRNPETLLVESMKKAEVLMLGEYHETPNQMRSLGKGLISKLAEAGATHFAIEVDSRFQPDLDEFMETRILSESFKSNLKKYAVLLADDDYSDLLIAAQKAGLKLIAVDKPRDDLPPPPPGQPYSLAHIKASQGRDTYMATQLEGALKDPKSKIIYWVGAGHGQDPPGHFDIAAEVLRQHGKSVISVKPLPTVAADTLSLLSSDLKKPVAIPTAKTEKFAQLPTNNLQPVERYGDYDIVVAFPRAVSGSADR